MPKEGASPGFKTEFDKGGRRHWGWSSKFVDPIMLPNGRQLLTLLDAGEYFRKLPNGVQAAAAWQSATEALQLSHATRRPS